ncbi:ketoacyl-synthetase C-terminal extension domain-containing protein, partial [Actinomadura fulvescens]|uniref:ketoacyl-synthetase C-terminal extension domain-containing protein n=1 Tax=Actinomadura fulvescens TaxID=46160 RepID=UPI00397CA4DA
MHGVIVGAATNNDGRTMGLALPNADAQEALLRRVYTQTQVSADEVVYVEAHGTGTMAGDPAECRALGRALGTARTRGPLPIGSVKSNLGHLEPASGMAGLLKALLVLRHRIIPATLHADDLNPDIDFDTLGLTVTTRARPVEPVSERPVVGINSFGFGGANVHIALAAPPSETAHHATPAPETPDQEMTDRQTAVTGAVSGLPVVVSAHSPAALQRAVELTADHLESLPEEAFYDVAYTAGRRRGLRRHRTVVLAPSAASAGRALRRLTEEPSEDGLRREGKDRTSRLVLPVLKDEDGLTAAATAEAVEHGRVALVFSGNGSQWPGMGADLLAGDAVFGSAVEAVDAELAALLGWSVAAELALPPRRWRLSATEVAQPL